MEREQLLIVDRDMDSRSSIRRHFEAVPIDFEVFEAASTAEAADALDTGRWGWVVVGSHLPESDARDLLREIERSQPSCAVIVVSRRGSELEAAELMLGGAHDQVPLEELSAERLIVSLRASKAVALAEHEASRAAAGYEFLASVGASLLRTVDVSEVVEVASRSCVEDLADVCIFDVEEDGERPPSRLGFAHAAPSVEAEHREAIEDSWLAAELLSTLRGLEEAWPIDFDSVPAERIAGAERGADAIRAMSLRRGLILPLRSRGRHLGYLTLGRCSVESWDALSVTFLARFAELVALALDNALVHERLGRAIAQRDRVLAVVAHDLRNPLGAIHGSIRNLLELDLPEPTRRRQLDLVEAATHRMARLVDDLLDIAQLEEGSLGIEPGDLDPEELIDRAAEFVSERLRVRGVELEREMDIRGARVRADPTRAAQILGNLLDNAARHSPENGRIVVRAEAGEQSVRFSVKDEGPGIDPEIETSLFERFWQSTGTWKKGRAGLGLTIARGLIEAHGGEIGVEDQPGPGATFWFTLPRV